MRLKLSFALLVFILSFSVASLASAACSGSGASWTCTSWSDLEACVESNSPSGCGTDGDTITVSGSGTWTPSSTISIPSANNITIVGPGASTLTIDMTGIIFDLNDSESRISGFKFNYDTQDAITVNGSRGFRIDHCDFVNNTGASVVAIHANGTYDGVVQSFGLIDHCNFTNGRVLVNAVGSSGTLSREQMSIVWAAPINLGSSEAVYVEDCDFTRTDGYYRNAIDANRAGKYVFRFNTFSKTYLEAHSLQSDDERATKKFEIYGNTATTSISLYSPFYIRGGTGVAFGNTVSGSYSNNFIIDVKRSVDSAGSAGLCDNTDDGGYHWDGQSDSSGWPCRDSIGRGQDTSTWYPGNAYNQTSLPAYFWDNTGTVTVVGSSSSHLQKDRDFYEDSNSNVATGTLASRPSSCTVNQAYWATDQGSWNQSSSGDNGYGFGNGVLYKCTATDTWTTYYTPYTYPHPLTGEGGDATPPTVTVTTSDPQNITTDSLYFEGTASDANGIDECKWRIGTAPDESNGTAASGTTAWSATASGFSQGANTLYAGCADPSNNWGSDSITVNFDSIAPVISSPTPTGEQSCSSNPRSVNIGVTTNENATCKFDTSDVSYDSMGTTFSSTGSTTHSHTLTLLACGAGYTRYVRCKDSLDNKNSSSTTISFSIAGAGVAHTARGVSISGGVTVQ